MKHHVKIGLLVGAIGVVLNACVSFAVGICGPLTATVLGAVAGYFGVQKAALTSKKEGGKMGAVAGTIAGGLAMVGQMLGGMGALVAIQGMHVQPIFGTVPPPSAEASQQLWYYGAGFGTGLCFGVIGLLLAGLAGYGAGYWGAPLGEAAAPAEVAADWTQDESGQ